GLRTQVFGSPNLDQTCPGDFDGDGFDDLAVRRPTTGQFFAALSGGGTLSPFIGSSNSVPVLGDFDGDEIDDMGAYDTTSGVWTLVRSTAGPTTVTLGGTGSLCLMTTHLMLEKLVYGIL